MRASITAKRRVRVLPIILLVFILAAAVLLYDSNTRLVTTEYEMFYDNLPAAFDGFRIVVLSDIHAAEFGNKNVKLVSKVMAAEPDIIAITGDFTDYHEPLPIEEQLLIAETLVEALIQIAPIYYITGNHEWDGGGIWELLEMLEGHGVGVLRNSYTLLESGGETIILAGTDDPNGPADMIKPDMLVERIIDAEGKGFFVMLEHRNKNLQFYSDLGVDLILSGHAHGGKIRLPFTDGLIGPSLEWLPSNTNGVYTIGGTNMLVSRGIGNHTGFPRFLNNPHIAVAVLRNSEF